MSKTTLWRIFLPLSIIVSSVQASIGDSSIYYKDCGRLCISKTCANNGDDFIDNTKESLIDTVVFWRCIDQCKYDCMWKTVEQFEANNWPVPQFHGKWPFIRWFGMQEPASVVFSIFNLIVHVWGFYKIRKSSLCTAPFYYMWQWFAMVCINAWTWSTVFHTRDTDATELLDYSAAYSMVISMFYCMMARVALHGRNPWYKVALGCALGFFFYRHFVFLARYQGYSYNMKVNIATGVGAGAGWMVWAFGQRKRRAYVRKLILFVVLSALALCLEIIDFPPVLYVFDSHSIWHLVTAPLTILLYSFILDDCTELVNETKKDKIP